MATGDIQPTFESLLNQATDPNNQEDQWDCIQSFYQLVNQEDDGPQVAIRLLAHKIQSPQEKEALQALTILEACMNNCGKRFRCEAAKFRFLNELIKVLTPKYFGAWTPQKVKDRVTEVLYGWTLWLKEEPKIQEAYLMLKKQGIVKKDPILPDKLIMAPPKQRTTESVFDQDDKAKLLDRLLKSGRPEDLENANRLIKSTVKEEQEKAEKVSKRESTLKEVESSTKQLRELLGQQTDTGKSLQPSDDLKALYERCDRLRPSLFRLASDTMEDDAALAHILAANDELTVVINAYKDQVGRKECNGGTGRSTSKEESYHLIDLSALDSPQTRRKTDSPPPQSSSPLFFSSYLEGSDQDFTELGIAAFTPPRTDSAVLTYRSLPQNHEFSEWGSPSKSQKQLNKASTSPLKLEETFCFPLQLKNIFVPVETIKPSHLEPVNVYDHGGVHVSLHFARDSPPDHPGVAVVVLSTVNTSALSVTDFQFQAAVPKTMSVKLQPASGTHLPPYNPLLPPPAISQVLLLANPQKVSDDFYHVYTLCLCTITSTSTTATLEHYNILRKSSTVSDMSIC
uniref:ADP-ribosylation factor-binding protein GGA2-like n=1 Tax=Sphaeramia orbicularis TaxID=375764 RepID=A0A672YG32_9TELE